MCFFYRKHSLIALTVIGLPIVFSQLLQAEEIKTDLQDQTDVAVTIYNENLALIRDTRKLKLKKGSNQLAFKQVSAQIKPETALLRSLTHAKGFKLIEQNFDFDLLTPQKLLEKYVGKSVTLVKVNPATGKESKQQAKVLSVNNGTVLKIGDSIVTGIPGRIEFSQVPDNLREQPTLVLQLNSGSQDTQSLELSYLTGGLSWQADYVAKINQQDNQMDLTGWVTLTNRSGTHYNNARLQLVAGDVNQVEENLMITTRSRASLNSKIQEEVRQESLFEYHLYSLGRRTSLLDNQTKQVSLLTAIAIPVTKNFILQGETRYYLRDYGRSEQKQKIGVFVDFKNSQEGNLGIPLPKGIIRVYKKDEQSNAQFIGEDRIDHTPKNELVSIKLGDAFDITARKKQTDFRRTKANAPYDYSFDTEFAIELKNAKSEAVTVMVREPIPGDWKIKSSSHAYKKISASLVEWQIKIPAESTATLQYLANVRY